MRYAIDLLRAERRHILDQLEQDRKWLILNEKIPHSPGLVLDNVVARNALRVAHLAELDAALDRIENAR